MADAVRHVCRVHHPFLWLMMPAVASARGGHSQCQHGCALEEAAGFWSNCCCISCSLQSDGVDYSYALDDPSLRTACCSIQNAYVSFYCWGLPCLLLTCFYLLRWFDGYGVVPTLLVMLGDDGGEEKEEGESSPTRDPHCALGPRDTLPAPLMTVWDLTLRSFPLSESSVAMERPPSSSPAEEFYLDRCEYWADVQYAPPLSTPVLSVGSKAIRLTRDGHARLQDYLAARGGTCAGPLLDPTHPTRGLFVIFRNEDGTGLCLYREWAYAKGLLGGIIAFSSVYLLCVIGMIVGIGSAREWIVVSVGSFTVVLLSCLGHATCSGTEEEKDVDKDPFGYLEIGEESRNKSQFYVAPKTTSTGLQSDGIMA